MIVWATTKLTAPPPVTLRDRLGRTFIAVPGEHTFVAVGYAPGEFTLLDAWSGEEKRVRADAFDASWATLGRQAVVITSR